MRNFYPIPFAPYNDAFSSRQFNGPNGKGTMVEALVKWFTYTVAGQPLGTANPQLNVTVDLNSAASQTVNVNWVIRSVYIDNEGVNFPVYVFFPTTKFAISCPPNSSGWYQVFAADRRVWIIAEGIADVDIANQVVTNVFFTDAVVASYLDQEAPTAVSSKLNSPVISIGGGGGNVTAITITDPGLWLNGTGLSITGSGGSGALAHLRLDSYGRAVGTVIDSGGNNYVAAPTVQYTGGYLAPDPWASIHDYPVNSVVGWTDGFAYNAINATSHVSPVPPSGTPQSGYYWVNSGLSNSPRAPTFQSTIAVPSGVVSFGNNGLYGPEALGDQVTSYIDTVAANGAFRNDIFNTPYQAGYIYLTNIFVAILGAAPNANCDWFFEDNQSNIIIPLAYHLNGAFGSASPLPAPCTILNLQGCNLKIPADRSYRLRAANVVNNLAISHTFVWSYSNLYG